MYLKKLKDCLVSCLLSLVSCLLKNHAAKTGKASFEIFFIHLSFRKSSIQVVLNCFQQVKKKAKGHFYPFAIVLCVFIFLA